MRGPWSARRSGRRSRSPACCWPDPDSPADLVSDSAALAADRHALLTGSASLGEVLGRRGLVLRADLLTPWARWITPEASPRRFDTWFFAAALPPGQTATAAPEGFGDHADPGESESGTWLGPAAALEAAQAGEITLLPPTAVTLGELAGHHDVAGILARRLVITPRLPKVIVEDGRARLAMPPPAKSDREPRGAAPPGFPPRSEERATGPAAAGGQASKAALKAPRRRTGGRVASTSSARRGRPACWRPTPRR